MAKNKSYDVGYGKPPKHSQFKSGKSGNPKGRPKGVKNLKTELAEELAEKIPIKEAGKTKKVTKQRAMIKSMAAKAVQGDMKATSQILNLLLRLSVDDMTDSITFEDLSAADAKLLEEFEASIQKGSKATDEKHD